MLNIIPRSILYNLDCHIKDKYHRKEINLIESTIQNTITFQKFLLDLQTAKEFA